MSAQLISLAIVSFFAGASLVAILGARK